MSRGYENTQTTYTNKSADALLDERTRRQLMREVLPTGRAIDHAELRRMIDDGSTDYKAGVLRRELVKSAARERASAIVLSDAERQTVLDYLAGKVRGADGKLYNGQAGAIAPIQSWP